jgi:hypothetical protein
MRDGLEKEEKQTNEKNLAMSAEKRKAKEEHTFPTVLRTNCTGSPIDPNS